MKLISAGPSPFVRKVQVLLHETGQTEDVEIINVAMTPTKASPEAVAANPTGKIPVLVREDGAALYDSRVITRFFDERAGAGLYPAAHLWETLTLEATGDAIMDAAVLMVYEYRVRPVERIFDEWVEAQWAKIERSVAAVNERWMSHLTGRLDMSHIAMGCALGYLDFRHGDRDWRRGNDALEAWYTRFAQRESMRATLPG